MVTNPSKITIKDVAQLAGVSIATVSKVLNNHPHVSRIATERVLDAVRKLDYRPNTMARSLKKNHAPTIGLLTDDLEGVFTMSLMRGVEEAAREQGYSVFLCNSYGDPRIEEEHLETLLAHQVAGVILMSGYRVHERGGPVRPLGTVPTVFLYQYTHALPISSVIPDDVQGCQLGTQHLIGCGKQRIAMISGPLDYEAVHQRLNGYRAALKEAGLPFDAGLVRYGEWHEQSGYELAHELMRLPMPPDALFCTSDRIAIGALEALKELKLAIPHEVAILGFDDRPPSAYQRPPLSTVALPFREMGVLACELLGEMIANGDGPEKPAIHRVPCHLVARESTMCR